ncbi:MAG: hypothetical protein LBF41_01125, partial [Deltaproteobacteria bacterium]|nr:hypothetical protein [Deltaproteobacteria bacterium]
DNCARIATFLTLALLNPRTDDINDAIETMLPSPPPDFPVEIELTPKFTMANLLSEATNFDYRKRYLETGAGPSNADPHIIFKVNGREVANAVVNVETYRLIPEGMSLGTGDPNDATGGARLSVGVIVSVAAKANTPAGASTAPAPPASPSAPVAPAATANPSEPGSIVTIMYKNNLG